MFVTRALDMKVIWINTAAILLMEPLESEYLYRLHFEGAMADIYFEGTMEQLCNKIQLKVKHVVKVMTSVGVDERGKQVLTHFITRDVEPKYFGDTGWSDKPFVFGSKTFAKTIAANL